MTQSGKLQTTSDIPLVGNGRLKGRRLIVTGAGSRGDGIGIGRAIAIYSALEGAKVALIDQDLASARRTIELAGSRVAHQMTALSADVTSPVETSRVVELVGEQFGGLDGLVNNVGIIGPAGTAKDVDPDAWSAALDVNVKSAMLMSRQCLPFLEAAASDKAILNIASIAGMRGGHPNLLYPVSKAAMINMTRVMAAHHGGQGVRVNAIAPGMVETPMVGGDEMSEERREQRRSGTLLKTRGCAWDVAKAAVFLLSADARWVTGVLLPVDAGSTAAAARPPVSPS